MKLNELIEKDSKTPFYQKELDGKVGFYTFVKGLDLDINVDDNMLFIILSFILSFYARRNDEFFPTGIDYKLFSKSIGSSANGGRQILRRCQKILASLSIDVLQTLAAYQGIDKRFFNALIKIGENNLPCFPCHLGMKLLISAARFQMIPLSLSIKRFSMDEVEILYRTFYVNRKANRYMLESTTTFEHNSISRICIVGKVVEANISHSSNAYFNRLSQYSVEDILLFNMASHPQFSGDLLRKYIDNPYQDLKLTTIELNKYRSILDILKSELTNTRKMAETLGFSRDNPTIFALQHVLAAAENPLQYKKKDLELSPNTKRDTRQISNDLRIFND